MGEAVLVAIITASASIIGQLLISRETHKKDAIADAVRQQKLDDHLSVIDKKLDEHNGYAKKFGDIADSIDTINIRLTEVGKDIEYLRKGTEI